MTETHDDREFAGRRALVTGASQGLGRAIALRLVRGGAAVIGASRSVPEDPAGIEYVPSDLGTEDGVAGLVEAVDRLGPVDILVQNAGISSSSAVTLDIPDAAWADDFAVNLMAVVRLDRALVPRMADRGRGVVVHVSSVAGYFPGSGQASYSASKAALNAYSRTLAVEVGTSGVRVVRIVPGFIPTEGAHDVHQRFADDAGVSLEEMRRSLAERLRVPMGRPGEPEDAAELVAFLASDRAKWLTGAEYRVDGGIIPTL